MGGNLTLSFLMMPSVWRPVVMSWRKPCSIGHRDEELSCSHFIMALCGASWLVVILALGHSRL